MNKTKLYNKLEEFKKGTLIISIHEKYKEDFVDYLQTMGITKYYVDKKRCYLRYRTSSTPWVELRNSELRLVRQITREEKLKQLNNEKKRLEDEIASLNM